MVLDAGERSRSRLALLALALLAALGLMPLVLEPRPMTLVSGPSGSLGAWLCKAVVIATLLGGLALRTWLDADADPWPLRLAALLVGLSGAMTLYHWFNVDIPGRANLQGHYLEVLNNKIDPPHPFRPLPYGIIRSLERFTGDWDFASFSYRWCFSHLFVWGWYRLARLFLCPRQALVTLLAVPIYYPLSVLDYAGQPTDPASHALFVLALIGVIRDKRGAGFGVLAGVLALGVMAKETIVLVVPAYWACSWRQGWPALLRTILLGTVCVAAFLAVRLPLGWRPGGNQSINGTSGLMVRDNLGIGEPTCVTSVPRFRFALQPALFVGVFLPFIAWGWWRLDGRLRALFLILTPLLLASSLCFSWIYEARNYMPLIPLLTTMTVCALRRSAPEMSQAARRREVGMGGRGSVVGSDSGS